MSVTEWEINTRAITAALARAKGTAYDAGNGSLSWMECQAHAMALAACIDTYNKVARSMDPARMSDPFLSRWEKILRIKGAASQTYPARRAEVTRRFLMRTMGTTQGDIVQLCEWAAPDIFDSVGGIVHTAQSAATVHTLVSTVIPSGIDTSADTNRIWSSSVSTIFVLLSFPTWINYPEYDRQSGAVLGYLDDALPAWCDIAIGTSTAGFVLTTGTGNLGNAGFDA